MNKKDKIKINLTVISAIVIYIIVVIDGYKDSNKKIADTNSIRRKYMGIFNLKEKY